MATVFSIIIEYVLMSLRLYCSGPDLIALPLFSPSLPSPWMLALMEVSDVCFELKLCFLEIPGRPFCFLVTVSLVMWPSARKQ